MRSGSVLRSGCLPALLRPGCLPGSGSLLCLRLQGISALRAKGLVIGYFSSTLRTKHKTPPHKQAPIRHYCRSGPLSSLNQFKISSASAPAEPPIPAEPSSFSAESPASAGFCSPPICRSLPPICGSAAATGVCSIGAPQ